ncbi:MULTISPECIES: transposase [unclassified Bacillus (in: firmicutes)]|uniref:transposase n=1 Tax=unclassified Bacillus (in: firmicutes) TaxID=185979 RepID=UPI0020363B00|nr:MULTISPECIES: transposase [unclassified Bacillus (in: firmicutes)]
MLKTILGHIDFLTEQIEMLDKEVAGRVSSHQEDVSRLDSIPGIATRMAEQILSEIGTDVKKQFPTTAHMCSWAGLVPGHNESAGKRKSAKTKKGNKYLRSALTEAAHSVRGSKNYLGALYRRTASRKRLNCYHLKSLSPKKFILLSELENNTEEVRKWKMII